MFARWATNSLVYLHTYGEATNWRTRFANCQSTGRQTPGKPLANLPGGSRRPNSLPPVRGPGENLARPYRKNCMSMGEKAGIVYDKGKCRPVRIYLEPALGTRKQKVNSMPKCSFTNRARAGWEAFGSRWCTASASA